MQKFDFRLEFSRDYPRIKRARYYPSGGELFQIQKMNTWGLLWTPSKRQEGKLFSADEKAFHGCEESKLKIGWSVCRQAERRFSQVHREKGSRYSLTVSLSLDPVCSAGEHVEEEAPREEGTSPAADSISR